MPVVNVMYTFLNIFDVQISSQLNKFSFIFACFLRG